jgi:twitching motility protein PilT
MFPAERVKEMSTQLSFALTMVIGQKLVPNAQGGGRRVAMEVLKNAAGMSHLIRSGKWEQIYAMIETQRGAGMITMERHLMELLEQRRVTKDAALRAANTRSLLAMLGES